MKSGNRRLLPAAMLAIGLVIGSASAGYAAHPVSVPLRDANGNLISAANNTAPYSPKMTCTTAECHTNAARFGSSTGTAMYENSTAYATKDHGTGTPSYQVAYPQHGVTAGYHFQQGRNLDWGSAQKDFFHQAQFTSSGGMVGKY